MRGDPRRGSSTGLRGAGAGPAPVRAPEILSYLRHNPVQELLSEIHGVRQSTVSRVIANTQDLARPAHRPQKTTGRLPGNHHSCPRTHKHPHTMNKPP